MIDLDRDKALQLENKALKELLEQIANIAHHGGLLDLGKDDALTAIRRLTISRWDKEECTRLQLLSQHNTQGESLDTEPLAQDKEDGHG